ncbi:unnamed protein product, partial [Phaeothamnion confervicola]
FVQHNNTQSSSKRGRVFNNMICPVAISALLLLFAVLSTAYDGSLRGGRRSLALNPITGTAGADILIGTVVADGINAGAGNDVASGRDGNDVVNGQGGYDRLAGGNGDDQVNGGAGYDLISGGPSDDILAGGASYDEIFGGVGDDVIKGGGGGGVKAGGLRAGKSSGDFIYGGDGDDQLIGGGRADLFDIDALLHAPLSLWRRQRRQRVWATAFISLRVLLCCCGSGGGDCVTATAAEAAMTIEKSAAPAKTSSCSVLDRTMSSRSWKMPSWTRKMASSMLCKGSMRAPVTDTSSRWGRSNSLARAPMWSSTARRSPRFRERTSSPGGVSMPG